MKKMKKMKILSIIPARGGSKGLPGKNLRPCHGVPLIVHSIRQSLACPLIDRTVVSTDDEAIARVARGHGAQVPFLRPAELARDDSTTESAMEHALDFLEREEGYLPEAILLLQPTSPLRTPGDLIGAIELFQNEGAGSLLSVFNNAHFLWSGETRRPLNYDHNHRPRRQDKEWELVENGSLYLTRVSTFREAKNRLGGKIAMYVMPAWRSPEIDDQDDLRLVEFQMARLERESRGRLADRLAAIRMLVLDFDGVFTDGSVYIDDAGNETVRCSRVDGKGLQLLRESGTKVVVISAEAGGVVEHRCGKLGLDGVHAGIKNKVEVYERIKDEFKMSDAQICFCGDDLQDLELMELAGLGCCPANGVPAVKEAADIVLGERGGEGFIRRVCDLLLEAAV